MNSLVTFNFNNNELRTEVKEGEPWFCLADACKNLSIADVKNASKRLDEKGKRFTPTLTKGGKQELTFINEPNLYRLIFRSNKPQAQAFADWVYSEVLPSIRKTGGYGLPQVDMKAIGGAVKRCAAVAVREEINKLLTSCESEDEKEVSDNDLLLQLHRWHCTKNKKDTIEFRKLHAENEELKAKLIAIKKTLG